MGWRSSGTVPGATRLGRDSRGLIAGAQDVPSISTQPEPKPGGVPDAARVRPPAVSPTE